MNTPQGGNRPASAQRKKLPVNPSLEHLQKQAKRRAKQTPSLQLATAQHQLALEYGCKNWAELARIVETMSRGADQLANVKMEFEELAKAARAVDMVKVREVLAAGEFTQHDLDQALSHSLWYGEESGWVERKEIADLLLSHGADPDGQYGSGYGPIVFGTCECLQPEALQYLIEAGADVAFSPIQTKYGKVCPLDHVGTYVRGRNERKHRVIDILLRHGAYVPPNLTPPILAIHRGDAKQLAELLDGDPGLLTRRFPDMPFGNMELRGATLLHCAVEFGEIECLEELFKRYTDINMKAAVIDGIGGQTPIFHAINTNCDGNFSTLEYLVKRVGQWVDMSVRATWRMFGEVQTKPMTPLEYAESMNTEESRKWRKMIDRELVLLRSLDHAEQLKAAILREDEKEVTQLLDAHPDLMAPTLWPLAIFQAKSLTITRLLLDRGLSPDECSAPRKPLHLAVYQCLPEIVDLLIERGADVNLLNPLGERPLDLLDAYEPRPVGDPEARRIRRALLAAGAQDDLFTVIRAGEVGPLKAMLEADPSLAKMDSEIGGPLFVAARSGRVEITKLLLEAGADPNKVNSKGNTPLWFAAQSPARPASDRIEVMKFLLEADADLHRRCENGSTALHFAAWRGPVEVVEFLLSCGADREALDDHGRTPLDDAERSEASSDREAIVELLGRPKPNESAADVDEQVVQAVLRNDRPSLQRYLDAQPEKISLTGGAWNKPLLHCAAWEGHLEIVRELVKRGANVNQRCESDQACAIHFAAERGFLEIVKLLVGAGSTIEAGDNDHQLSVLGWATSLGRCEAEVARYLLSQGAKMTIWSAIALGDEAAVRSLVAEDPALLQARMSRNEYHRSVLHHAVERNQPGVVKLLVELGADPRALDSTNLTVLGAGSAATSPEIYALLEAHLAPLNLHDALNLGRFDRAQALLEADPGCIKPGGAESGLFVYAVCRKNWEAAEWLLDRGADIDAIAEVYGCPATALHFAIESAPADRVRWLLDMGADTTIRDGIHHGDALGWAEFFGKPEMAWMIREHRENP